MTLLWGECVGASIKNSVHPDLCRGSSYSVSLETHRKLSLQVMKQGEQVALFFSFAHHAPPGESDLC